MEPVWSDGPILPARLLDIVADAIEDVTMDKYKDEGEMMEHL